MGLTEAFLDGSMIMYLRGEISLKRMITTVLMLAVMLCLCSCSGGIGENAKFPIPKAPEGWEEHITGPMHLFYPGDKYSKAETDNGIKLTNDGQTAYVSVSKEKSLQGDIAEIDEEYLNELADSAAKYHDSLYEEAYGLPFDTAVKNLKSEVKNIGNGKCVCLSYDIETSTTLVAISMTASYYQVFCSGKGDVYAVDFCVLSEDGKSAEKYFSDIIGKMFVE